MGCGGSKLEELNAVALCRDRSELLAEAIRHRYALADAHAEYADSLCSFGVALHRMLDVGAHLQGSPVLSLPAQRKGDPLLRRRRRRLRLQFTPTPDLSLAHTFISILPMSPTRTATLFNTPMQSASYLRFFRAARAKS
ncbi:uncharacterized protein LOC110020402 [Phalaenopsis equestris]|uniref:uncharacterized protein LOC110020402 n=1 Tax=Phalaenopsis equestris TaxID=78828 RepID=UPI0009E655C1|nr:uncharacterized protein LOC110020402 [Phalaenopsis equestris]